MASLQIFPSKQIDFVNQTGSVNLYMVPNEWTLILYSVDVLTISSSSLTVEPVITIGNAGNHSAYESTHLENTYDFIPSVPPERQTVPSATTVTATIQTNSTATSHKGLVVLVGYLVPATAYGV